MPHEVRVLSWVQLLLCIRLRAGNEDLFVPIEVGKYASKRACFDKVYRRVV